MKQTDNSNLIGSPVGLLDLSVLNKENEGYHNNRSTSPNTLDQPPSNDTVKLVGIGSAAVTFNTKVDEQAHGA